MATAKAKAPEAKAPKVSPVAGVVVLILCADDPTGPDAAPVVWRIDSKGKLTGPTGGAGDDGKAAVVVDPGCDPVALEAILAAVEAEIGGAPARSVGDVPAALGAAWQRRYARAVVPVVEADEE